MILDENIEGKIIKARMHGQKLAIKFSLPKEYELCSLVLYYRTKKEAEECSYEFSCKKTRSEGVYTTVIDFADIQLKPNYWDIAARLQTGQYVRLVNRSLFFYFYYCKLFGENAYIYDDGMILFPYVSSSREISVQYRIKGDYDGFYFRLKERLGLLRYILTYPFLKRKKIMLVFEKACAMAQDNGYYFFKYCMENNMEKELGYEIYYVIDKKALDREKLVGYERNVIDFMSTKHMAYALAAKLLVSTDARQHIYPPRRKGSMLFHFVKKAKLVFLQHGVTAMKRVDFFYGKTGGGRCDAFITTSDYEQKIIVDNFGYSDKEAPITGFARWDVLEDKSEGCREILVMPTWRSWLDDATDEIFKKSDYFKHYTSLLQSDKLLKMLEEEDLQLNFYLHTKFRDYIKNFDIQSERIHLMTFGETPLNELMMRCKLLVTDYSSVAWDVFYQNKPVVFFQFDRADYLDIHGSYMDFEKELFGKNVLNIDELCDTIKEHAENDFELSDEIKEKHGYYFKYVDNQNSKRICDFIRTNM